MAQNFEWCEIFLKKNVLTLKLETFVHSIDLIEIEFYELLNIQKICGKKNYAYFIELFFGSIYVTCLFRSILNA